ncbi:hypothetical protein H2198_007879 [Neophaeococcomyces mojaviensis]|uniref:Uncharacterized protein n=1 Tax=Neophaeococcomyces mojaviensis TaxID=3383035 RepID=A0ACC2ZYU4_9EURO|nr:hypothetical protein H2198_007879 [Knufia sp. JES_112]
MCGRKHQRRAYGACNGAPAYLPHSHSSTVGVAGVIEAIQQIRLGGATARPAAHHDTQSLPKPVSQQQTQGVIYTPASTVVGDDERTHSEKDGLEMPPTYDESVDGDRLATRNTPMDNKHPMEMPEPMYQTQSVEDQYHQQQLPRANGGALGVLAAELTQFQSALTSYREGACGGRGRTKRAAKHLVHEMYAAEMARRQAETGRLVCGERKQIKRDLKPVKQMLKSAVWEAKSQRRG